MPTTLCTIVSSIVAAFISLLATPYLHQHGLVPFFETLPIRPSFAPNVALFDDSVFLTAHPQSSNISNHTSIPWTAHLLHEDPHLVATSSFQANPKPSSSTTTTPPTASPPPSPPVSAMSFYRYLSLRLASAVFTTLATLSLRLANFWLLNPTLPPKNPIVFKKRSQHANNAIFTEAAVLDHYIPKPTTAAKAPTYADAATETPTSLPPSPTSQEPAEATTPVPAPAPATPTPAYVDAATDVPTWLPSPPMPAAAATSSSSLPPRPQYRHTAASFVPRPQKALVPKPVGPSTDTPGDFQRKFPMHGTRG